MSDIDDGPAPDSELVAILEAENYQDLKATLLEFESLHDQLDDLKLQMKALSDRYDTFRQVVVPESMKYNGVLDEHGKGSCTTPSGRKVYITTDTRAFIRKEDEELAHRAIIDMGYGELIRPTIHPQTLTAFIRERLENGEEVPTGVGMYQQEKAVLRKS